MAEAKHKGLGRTNSYDWFIKERQGVALLHAWAIVGVDGRQGRPAVVSRWGDGFVADSTRPPEFVAAFELLIGEFVDLRLARYVENSSA